MTIDEARAVLGLDATTGPAALREAYLRRVREHHPDITAHPEGAGERTATVIEAYRLLRDKPTEPTEPDSPTHPAPPPHPPAGVEVISEEALWIDAAASLVGRHLLETADDLGEISYVDASAGIVQVTLRPEGGPTCWLTMSLHIRPGGTVLVATLESIEAAPAPPVGPLLRRLADDLGARLAEETEFLSRG